MSAFDSAHRTEVCRFRKNNRDDVVVALDRFKEFDLIDVRVFTDGAATKKGVAMKIDRLGDLIGALVSAEREARARGLLPNDGGRT
jgi:hypothetical protein